MAGPGGAVLSGALKAPFVRPRRGPGALGGTGAWKILKPTAGPGPRLLSPPHPQFMAFRRAQGVLPALGLLTASWEWSLGCGVWDAELGMRSWMQHGGFGTRMEHLGSQLGFRM